MEKVIGALGEAFEQEYDSVTFTYNPTGSGTGIQAVSEGRCDIGLSSRNLKDEEKEQGLSETVPAYDGITVVVNHAKMRVSPIAKLYFKYSVYCNSHIDYCSSYRCWGGDLSH